MPARLYTRVAVAQLACHPAIALPDRAPLEDPLFDMARADSLRPEGEPPEELDVRFRALRERVARTYCDQLLLKVRAILTRCQQWGVRLIVFPEYSLPWQVLEDVAKAGGDMVIVAGTHSVTRPAVRSGIYERLGGTRPGLGEAVCPVLHRGRLLALQPKLSPAEPEQCVLKPGQTWRPVALPEGLAGPLGILVCLDFLHREGEAHRRLVGSELERCRFLAVPSYTPDHTIPEFSAKAQEEARRYRRPVLWADTALFSSKKGAGGSSIFVDEGHAGDLRRFPEHAGFLEPGDEGVLVSDVDLGFVRVGSSTRYDAQRPIIPFAAASLVYRTHPAGERYAAWLEEMAPLLGRDDDAAVDALAEQVGQARTLLQDAGTSGAAHGLRLRRLLREVDNFVSVEQFRRYTREVVLPPEALPLPTLRAAMAAGAHDAVFDWQKDWPRWGLGALAQRLYEAAQPVLSPDPTEWTEAGRAALGAVRRAVRGPGERPSEAQPPPAPEIRVVAPAGLDPAALGERRRNGFIFQFRPSPGDFRGALAREQALFLLAVAEGAGRTAAMAVGREGELELASAAFPVTSEGDRWTLRAWDTDRWWAEHGEKARKALEAEGLWPLDVRIESAETLLEQLLALLSRFEGARDQVTALRQERLASVNGQFVQPTVTVGDRSMPALEALDGWLASSDQTALLLGDYGSGKSTTLAVWCADLWKRPEAPRPLLCSLAATATTRDAEGLLLDAARVQDTPSNRAALRLLVQAHDLLPCFDGFDELATRLGTDELAGRLSELLAVAASGGRVVVSSREHYFESEEALRSTAAEALRRALGASAGLTRITVRPFTQQQVEELVRDVLPSEQKVHEALARIRNTYDLTDLVSRPLLLRMVLASLDRIDPTARVAPADIYDAYLQHWLSQTREDADSLSHAQKEEFAESLAEDLWRTGATSCAWQNLRRSVRERLGGKLPDHLSPAAAFRDIEGGAFFVREGGDRYRFAHKSFLEYFLARSLLTTLEAQPSQALDTRPLTREVAAFVGELLRRMGDPHEARALRAVQAFLRTGREAGTGAGGQGGYTAAAANALRLLHGLAVWAQDGAQWVPEGADLRGIEFTGEDLHGARLNGVSLGGALLAGVDLTGVHLERADLSRAVMSGAHLDGANLKAAVMTEADLTQVEAARCDATGAVLQQARLAQSVWLDCRWDGVDLGDAELSATVMAPAPRFAPTGTPQSVALQQFVTDPLSLHASLGVRKPGQAVTWSPDGRLLASASEDGTIHLWNAETGRALMSLSGHTAAVEVVAWAPDSRRLASAGADGTVRLWDTGNGRELLSLSGHIDGATAVAWAPDGRRLASAGHDRAVRVWDASSGHALPSPPGHTNSVLAVAWSPDGRRLASAGHDGTVRTWDADSGQELLLLLDHDGSVTTVAWAPDGHRLASGGHDATVRIWDADSGLQLHLLSGHTNDITAVAWAPDGHRLASVGLDGAVRMWDADGGDELLSLREHATGMTAVAWAPDGRRLVLADSEGSVFLLDAGSGRALASLSASDAGMSTVVWGPNGRDLYVAALDGTGRLWDAEGLHGLLAFGSSDDLSASAWHFDNRRLAFGSSDGMVHLWDLKAQKDVSVFKHPAPVMALAWSPDGRRLASLDGHGTIRVSSAGSEFAPRVLSGPTAPTKPLAWSPDSRRLASADDHGTILIWDTDNACVLISLSGHAPVMALAWSPDGRSLASAGSDRKVRQWDTHNGRKLFSLSGHTAPVIAVAWAPNGHRLASAGRNGTIHLWDTDSGGDLPSFFDRVNGVRALDWSPDGRRLASAGDEGALIWDVDHERLLARLEVGRSCSLVRTPSGYCAFYGDASWFRFAAPRPERPGTVLYLPLGGLRSVFDRRDKVRDAIAGEPVNRDELAADLAARGWAGGVPWDGESHRIPGSVRASPTVPARPVPLLPNPFRPGPALLDAEVLFGREGVAQELASLVAGRSPAILIGPRRAGKTSLLSHLAHRIAPGHTVRALSLEGRFLHSADDLALLLEPALGDAAPPGGPARKARSAGKATRPGKRSRKAAGPAQRLLQELEQSPGRVYLLDEIAWLHEADETLFPWLRALGQRYAPVVFAGSRWDWVRVVRRAAEVCPGSSFGNDVTEVVLGPLSEADARRFLTETAPGVIPDNVAAWVVELCGAWPFYLQVMGHALYVAAEAGSRKPFNEKAALAELYDQRLLVERAAVFEGRFLELPGSVQTLLKEHRDERPVFRELTPEQRELLIDTGLCTLAGVWLPDRPFFDWIRLRAGALEP